ncbi:hypothetical protein V8G54_022656 [Vigna mungo]|uniref:Transposase-associated domain-containing protein n=1 Tax=Vigna mungo TaxID=3915 RepID=A0AAQ3N3G9_VIGMU
MAHFPNHRGWMYDCCYSGRRGLKEDFVIGVEEFVETARQSQYYAIDGGIRCPCLKCECTRILKDDEVKVHLYQKGFMPNYKIWTFHGEEIPSTSTAGNNCLASGSNTFVRTNEINDINHMQEMVNHALGRHGQEEAYDCLDEESPNETTQRFYNLLIEANKPVFEGSIKSKLLACLQIMACKSNWNVPNQALDFMTKFFLRLTPPNNSLPKNFYEAKSCVSKLGFEIKKIDCCLNGCMRFYDNENGKNDASLVECKFCGHPRFQTLHPGRSQGKPIAFKSMFYLSIIPRLQRMFTSMQTAQHMTWHDGNKIEGVLCHPSDSEAWKHFNRKHPSFASEPCNVRLGLCLDGFTPYLQASTSPYSCWPVIVTPYNLPPEMCMTKLYMFLTCIISGPSNPKASIDIYLEPLIDDLKKLWSGIWTYDISRKQNFLMRTTLMWTINDFPAYGMLSGWILGLTVVEGSYAVITHLDETGKLFAKDKLKEICPPPKLTPSQIWTRVEHLPKVTESGVIRIKGYGDWHNWTKRSIFWDLPYWKDNLLRHNLDVMHIEKNFFDNIINTVMNLKALDNGRMLKPKANYMITKDEARIVCQWIKDLKMPDGYSSNLARCANIEKGSTQGMKSHDCHVFMDTLIPLAFSCLPVHFLNPLTKISHFFKDLSSTTLKADSLAKLEENIPIILRKLERVLPPAFFDSMEHLPIHLAYEAWLGGPVQYRWMYPFERFMGESKRSVKNKARVEGSICVAYLHRETTYFCSHYFKNFMLSTNNVRNETQYQRKISHSTLSVFQQLGRHAGKEMTHWLTDAEFNSVHVHSLIVFIIFNNSFLVAEHIPEGSASGRIHSEFPAWFRYQVHNQPLNPTIQELRYLANWPMRCVKEGHTYFVNGGTRIDPRYNIVELHMSSRYRPFDPFILASNVRQVYYVPYPPFPSIDKRGWCVAIQTKPRGRIDSNDVEEDNAYQVDEMSQEIEHIEVERVPGLQDPNGDFEKLQGQIQEEGDKPVQEEEGQEEEQQEKEDDEEEEEEDDDDDDDDDDFNTHMMMIDSRNSNTKCWALTYCKPSCSIHTSHAVDHHVLSTPSPSDAADRHVLSTPSHDVDRHVLSTPHPPINPLPTPDVLSTPDLVVQPTQDPTSLPPPAFLGTQIDSSSRPSSSSIPSSDGRPTPSVDHDSAGVDDDDPALADRPMIEPYGKEFVPSRVASQAITRSIKQQFLQPWPTWGAILPDDRKPFWERFKVQWLPQHEVQIQRNFHSKASHRLSEMFREARITGKRLYWIEEQIWTSLLEHWNSPQYRAKCAIAQKNRSSERGGVLHIGGSITIHEHAMRMFSTKLMFARELLTSSWMKGPERHISSHSSCPQSTQQTDDDEDHIRSQCWVDVVGGKKKGRIYGTWQLAANYSVGRGGLKHQPSSSSQRPHETIHALTQQLQKREREYSELRQEFTNFKELVMRLLPQSAVPPASHSQPTLVQPTEVQPTHVQSIPVQTPSVQSPFVHPTLEPQNNEQEDNYQPEHYDDY